MRARRPSSTSSSKQASEVRFRTAHPVCSRWGGSGYISGDAQVWASLRPFIGIFLVDGFELTFTNELLFQYGADQQLHAAILVTLEPSVHIALIDRLWLAIAFGMGVIENGLDAGVVGTSRLGIDILVGRSTMFHIAAVGALASVPFALPDRATAGTAYFRIGAELSFSALF